MEIPERDCGITHGSYAKGANRTYIKLEGAVLFYSYNTVIAVLFNAMNVVFSSEDKISVTTTKHLSEVKTFVRGSYGASVVKVSEKVFAKIMEEIKEAMYGVRSILNSVHLDIQSFVENEDVEEVSVPMYLFESAFGDCEGLIDG